MNRFEKWKLSFTIKITLSLTFVALFVDLLSDLAASGWDITQISVNWYTILFSVLVLTISLVAQFITNRLFILVDAISKEISGLPMNIKQDTASIVGTIKKDIDDFKEKLSSGIVDHEDYTYRALVYHQDKGEILNAFSSGNQTSRNILFSNKTINLIFRGIKGIDSAALKTIGRTSSERFAAELVENIRTQMSIREQEGIGGSSDLHVWIMHWIKFDSDAGFGKFYVEKDKELWKENKAIRLRYSFLAQDYEPGQTTTCDFMTGYIEGILNYFPPNVLRPYNLKPQKIVVTHDTTDPEQCMCAKAEPSDGCVYFINEMK